MFKPRASIVEPVSDRLVHAKIPEQIQPDKQDHQRIQRRKKMIARAGG